MGRVLGLPGLLGYRAVNTLDAMVGHKTMRYAQFGWAAARLDDVANLVPARVTALLAVAAGARGRRAAGAAPCAHSAATAARIPARTPVAAKPRSRGRSGSGSAARNVYQGRAERRGTLGDGPPPSAADIDRAIRLSRLVDHRGNRCSRRDAIAHVILAPLLPAPPCSARTRLGARPHPRPAPRPPPAFVIVVATITFFAHGCHERSAKRAAQ